jgi:nucleotide-binding universal stress UspA family protein
VRGDDAAAFRSLIDDRERARRYLDGVKRKLARRSMRSRVIVKTGDPIAEIVKCARVERVDLILMSTHGRSGIRRALMGSVAENVVRRVSVPILLVPARAR